MSLRELVVLGSASQVPTRHRNHNGYLLRWDEHGFLFDPGEGTQRQLIHAGVAVSAVTAVFVTHFHGDHSLGLASIVQRLSLDRVVHPVEVFFPASGRKFYDNLIEASIYYRAATVVPRPLPDAGATTTTATGITVEALPLDHGVPTLGYRLREPDQPRFLPERLEALGIRGPQVGELQRTGRLQLGDETVTVDQVSVVRPGATFAFVMDTRPCANAARLADGADLLVCESTFLESEAETAHEYRHLTAAQAARLARDAEAVSLLLTHFSQRYRDVAPFLAEAAAIFPGAAVARDLGRYPFPRPPAPAPPAPARAANPAALAATTGTGRQSDTGADP